LIEAQVMRSSLSHRNQTLSSLNPGYNSLVIFLVMLGPNSTRKGCCWSGCASWQPVPQRGWWYAIRESPFEERLHPTRLFAARGSDRFVLTSDTFAEVVFDNCGQPGAQRVLPAAVKAAVSLACLFLVHLLPELRQWERQPKI
jgi:hypothetical protein